MFSCLLLFCLVSFTWARNPSQEYPLTKHPKQTDYRVVKFLELLTFSKDVSIKEPLNRILVERMVCVDAASIRDPLVIDSENNVEVYGVMSKPGMIRVSRQASETDCKGMMLARMVHLTVGDEEFQQGLKHFFDTYKDKATTTDDLWSSFKLDRAAVPSGVTLKQIMNSWTDNKGYPIVIVTRGEDGEFKLTQKPFNGDPLTCINSACQTQQTGSCWWIPVTYSTAKSPDFSKFEPKTWLGCDKAESEIILKTDVGNGDWFIINNQFSAPYHVNYDVDSWRLIRKTLRDKNEFTKIHVLNRAQIVNDVISLAYMKELPFRFSFELLNYLNHEEDIVVWKFFFINIKKLTDMIIRTTMQYFGRFRNYLKLITRNVFEKTYPDKDLLANIISGNIHMEDEDAHWKAKFIFGEICSFTNKNCIEYSKSIFAEWKAKGAAPQVTDATQQELVAQILCTVSREGSEDEFNFIFDHLKAAKEDDSNRGIYIDTVACTFNHWMLDQPDKLLDWANKQTPDTVTPREKEIIYVDTIHSWIDFAIQNTFFYEHFDQMKEYHSHASLSRIIHEFALEMNEEEFEKLKSFLSTENVATLQEVVNALSAAAPAVRFRSWWNYSRQQAMVYGYDLAALHIQ